MIVRYWMKSDVVTVTESATLLEVLETMRKRGIRRLPVLRNGELCGIVSRADLYRYVDPMTAEKEVLPEVTEEVLRERQVSHVMVTSPLTCDPNTPLEDVAELMRSNNVGTVLVVQETKLLGIITESDVLDALIRVSRQGAGGIRITFQVPAEEKREAVYRVVDLCRQFELDLLTVLTHPIPDQPSQLVMVRVRGGDTERMSDAIWKQGWQVLSVESAEAEPTR